MISVIGKGINTNYINRKVVVLVAESLTQNQKRFADEYVMSGNGAEAYKVAYKNVKKDSTA